ncbi:MAG: hypothetical protein K0R22_35 [Sporomusa sp.]|jgi:hypothetical protein|nr:hypothetical protein [Sporomusa sp.]
MSLLKINDDWQIISDQYNWILQQRFVAEESGKERWSTEGYYPTLAGAVKGLVENEIKVPADIKGILEKLEVLRHLIDGRFQDEDSIISRKASREEPADDDLEDFLS